MITPLPVPQQAIFGAVPFARAVLGARSVSDQQVSAGLALEWGFGGPGLDG
ncbi:MAG: hypothetical protein ACK4N5_21635 [Myxococcales bacterium]